MSYVDITGLDSDTIDCIDDQRWCEYVFYNKIIGIQLYSDTFNFFQSLIPQSRKWFNLTGE